MKTKRLLVMLLAIMACSIQAWSYRFTDNYTIEVKFKINAIGAGIIFANYNGFGGDFYMWQFNVGNGTKSLFRPHHWNPGTLIEEKGTGSVTLNTTDWFVTKIVISNNGGHATTSLRRADDANFVEIDSRDGNFRFGMVGFRQDHDGDTNESASFDYIRITDTSDKVLYFEDFNAPVSWENDPIVSGGVLTAEGHNLQERRYRPNNMFKDAIDMHYAVEADVTIKEGYVSFVFGMNENGGSNYMWQISPNYYNDGSANTYYHLDYGNESWKIAVAGSRYPNFNAADFIDTKRHVKIEVVGNVVYTYIDNQLQDTFTQCDMTDLELLNSGKIGIRADGSNSKTHVAYIDNVKLTEYDTDGYPTVVLYEPFTGGTTRCFTLTAGASIVSVDGDYALKLDVSGSDKVRLLSSTRHSYSNGICQSTCASYQEPGYDTTLRAYTIGNLGQLIRFSEIVNAGETGANGSLTADIDMEYSELFTPIGLNNDGSWQRPFTGKFYGNNHVISNLYVKTDCEGGLFSRLRGGYIENLGLVNGHIESTANLRCGAMAGEHHDNAKMVNCYARGTFEFVTGHSQKDALAAEAAGGYFFNCYTTLPKITCDYPAPFGGGATNCYEDVSSSDPATTSGELCYNLGSAFHQTLGTDTYPELDVTKPRVYQIAVSNAGYATFVPEENIAAIPTGVTAYAGQNMGSYLHLEEVTELPADNAVVVKATEGNYYCNGTDASRTLGTSNNLTFYSSDTEATGTQYCLANKDAGIGFYQVQSGVTIPARKAYLAVPAGVKAFYGFEDDEATSIKTLSNSPLKGENIYNLAGQRISKMQRGINIINGKKVLK